MADALSDQAAMSYGAPSNKGSPPGLSDEAAMSFGAKGAGDALREKLGIPKYHGNFSDVVMHGGTFGLSDEIGAGLSAPVQYGIDKLTGRKPADATLGDYYNANLENIRSGEKEYAQVHPVANAAGEVTGSLLDLNPEEAATAVASGAREIAKQGAKVGAAMGATSGFGEAEGGFKNRAIGAVEGAAGGAALGATTPYLIGGAIGAGRMIRDAIAPWTSDLDTFINKTAGNVLNKAAGGEEALFEDTPLEGMKPTTGQATNNEGLKWLERSVEMGSPEGAAGAATARTANNQAIEKGIGQLGNLDTDASKAMSDAVEKASAAAKANTRAAWKAADVDSTTGVSATQLADHVQGYMDSLSVASRKNVNQDLLDTLDTLAKGGTTNLGEIQDFRSNVTDELRAAARSGQTNKARVLGGLADTISDFLDNIPMPGDAKEAYDAARAATKQMKGTFDMPKAVRNVLGTDRFGEDKTPLTAVADTYIRSGKGAPEAFDSYLDAVDSQLKSAARPGQTAPERIAAVNQAKIDVENGYQAARDAFAQRFLDRVQTTVPDGEGSPFISASKISNFIDDHKHIIDSRIFSDDQRDMIQRISDAADMAQRTARAGARSGSDTFGKLQGKTFLDELIGPGAAKLVNWTSRALPAVGAAVGGKMGGYEGAAAGAAIGSYGVTKLQASLYAATRDKVSALVTEAMSNPALAKTLMQTASKDAALKIPTDQRKLIYSLLGLSMAKPALGYMVPKDQERPI